MSRSSIIKAGGGDARAWRRGWMGDGFMSACPAIDVYRAMTRKARIRFDFKGKTTRDSSNSMNNLLANKTHSLY